MMPARMARAPRATGRTSRTAPRLRRRIAHYYDTTQVLYSRLWSPRSVHYGFWENGTRRREDAVRNLDRCVARALDLPARSRVLDAGCGIGGTSLFLAEEHGHDVVGVTLSEVQLRSARRAAARSAAPIRPRFELADYLHSGLPDVSLDGVVAVESACYARRKRDFAAEAFRLLRPGGRLVVSDGFLNRPVERADRRAYGWLLEGLALPNLASVGGFTDDLLAQGFVDVRCADKFAEIMPSVRMIEVLSYIGVAVCAVPCRLGVFPATWLGHGMAGISQKRLFENRTVAYCVFVATKPGRENPRRASPASSNGDARAASGRRRRRSRSGRCGSCAAAPCRRECCR